MSDETEPLDPESTLVGRLVEERYRITELIGEGGMGRVYLARDERLPRDVVLKVPNEKVLADAGFRERFQREITSLIGLEHPHVVKVLDIGEVGQAPYVLLQYLGGGTLHERLEAQARPQSPTEVLGWLPPIAEALDFIHRKGYVHRDVKPANILFDEDGHVYLGDFGIARALDDREAGLTVTGLIGSPRYMGPEVAMDRPYGPAYDQYALAVVAFQALSGRTPHEAATPMALVTMKMMQPPLPLADAAPHLPTALGAVLGRALSLEPEERWPSCRDFAAALANAVGTATLAPGEATLPPATSIGDLTVPLRREPPVAEEEEPLEEDAGTTWPLLEEEPPPEEPPRRGTLRTILILLVLGVVGVLAWQLLGGTQEPEPAASSPVVAESSPPPPAPREATAVAESSLERGDSEPEPESDEPQPAPTPESPLPLPAEAAASPTVTEEGTEPVAAGEGVEEPDAEARESEGPVSSPDVDDDDASPVPDVEPAAPVPEFDELRALLDEAAELERRQRLTTGQRHALGLYREVLVRRPGDREALAGLDRIQQFFAAQARAAAAAGDRAGLEAQRAKAIDVRPDSELARALRSLSVAAAPEPEPGPVEVVSGGEDRPVVPSPRPEPVPEPRLAAPLSELARNERGRRVFERSRDGARVVLVPGGDFVMGGDEAEADARPGRRVTLSPYLIDEREVTWRQLTAWMRDTGGLRPFRMPTWEHDESHPIVNATWDLASQFCAWAGGRLPTEAEWEHAARGSDGRRFPWGDDFDASAANWKGGSDPWPETAPVGSFPDDRSAHGLLDMGGNVTEWVADWYSPEAYSTPGGRDPLGPESGTQRVYRGGNWNHTSRTRLSATRRGSLEPGIRYATFGFRCAMDAPADLD